MRFCHSFPALLVATVGVLLAAGSASADSINCDGKNLLEDLKAKDPAAFTRIRTAADATKNGKTLLWKIESEEQPDHPASYLYGTLPVSDERLKKSRPAVEDALNVANRIATGVEDMSAERVQEALSVMQNVVLPGAGTKLSSLLPAAEAERTALLLSKTDLPKEVQPRVRPWVAALLTARSDCEKRRLRAGKLTQDMALAKQAEDRGIGTFGLETPEMQLGAMATVTDEDEVTLFRAGLAAHDRIDDQTETQVQLYLARDLGALWPLHKELSKAGGAADKALESYRENVLEERNARMRDRALMHLSVGGVFFAVDALHLPGDKGLVELLKDSGYKLTALD